MATDRAGRGVVGQGEAGQGMARQGMGIRLIALLCWFDEPTDLLHECVSSLKQAGVDYLVACDGAYALFPGASRHWRSNRSQVEAIAHAAVITQIPLVLHVPDSPWHGNEVEKRTVMFQQGNLLAQPGRDWFLVVDADETVTYASPSLKAELAACKENVGWFLLKGWAQDENRVRGLFRAHPSLRVEGAHYRYLAGESVLWGHPEVDRQEPAFDATRLLQIRHQRHRRPPDRNEAAHRYYEARDRAGLERMSWTHAL